MCRLFFSVLVLKTNREHQTEDGVQLLTALASGSTGWSSYAKALHILPAKALSQEAEQALMPQDKNLDLSVELLSAALASLPNIRTVMWHTNEQGFWSWARSTICMFLNSLPGLNELALDVQGQVDFSELQVRDLRKFTFKTPNWGRRGVRRVRDLVSSTSPPLPLMYDEISPLILQNRLRCLHLEGPNEWSIVWSALRSANQTKLIDVTTNVVSSELYDYLTSYRGIEKLTLKFPDGGNLHESNGLADAFFETVLPAHAKTLTCLSCPAAYESRFSFGTHNVDVVSQLHKLTILEMSINAGAVRPVDNPRHWTDPDGKVHRVVSIGRSVEAEQADIDPVVALLLETAATLPLLRSLAILSAETERNRGAWCGNGRIHHKSAVDAAIGRAMKTFRSDVACAAVVRACHNTYELRPRCGPEAEGNSDGGSLGYEVTGTWSRY
ncbi:hypothetical protein K438DRAFT_1842109 [Mycena galopus ATCC 62051]|nr:hypothetical protein K438DRAFT_1842109 [Mycena galopus ATCC 62051]